jgi:hypothetical protein
MPIRKPRTKKAKRAAVKTTMKEFKQGKLRSGSKSGPKVKNPKQAIAIALRQSGQTAPAKKRQKLDNVKF